MTIEKIEHLKKKMHENKARMTNWKLSKKERYLARARYIQAVLSLTN